MIAVRRGGAEDGPLLVLLHGLGHTAYVWREFVELLPTRWAGGWVAPDLPGHGGSGWLDGYSFDALAAELVPMLPPGRPVVLVGHSMGGVVALSMAAARPVDAVLGFGIKVAWTGHELTTMAGRAARPSKVFGNRDEALSAFVRFAGLDGVVAADSGLGNSGIVEIGDGYRLTTDPRTMAVGAPDMPALLAAARATTRGRVQLARGEHDHMVSGVQLRAVDPTAVTLVGAGHNPHVTHPRPLLDLITTLAG